MKKLNTLLALTFTLNAYAFKEIPLEEDYSLFLKGNAISNINEIAQKSLNSGKTSLALWSGHYWPMFQGSLAARYRAPEFDQLAHEEKTKKFKNYVKLRDTMYFTPVNDLSPSEKYDMLVGDYTQGLTMSQWKGAEDNSTFLSGVPEWRGICDGFAAASMTWNRPTHAVTMISANGQPVTFYPEDIKALGSQLHARGVKKVTFLGKRCKGGLFGSGCEETNSGALHLALVNRVGAEGRSFVVDASGGSEVWNYPVSNYKFTFKNPLTGEEAANWMEARELLAGNEKKFINGKKRAEGTVWIVSVLAEVELMDMREPGYATEDSAELDKILKKKWYYDLEIDASGKIIGGEWNKKKNGPDFMWAPREDSKPIAAVEKGKTLHIDERRSLDAEIQSLAMAASQQGQPLAVIVNKLFEMSQK